MRHLRTLRRRAFTLIELLTVIAIIGILATMIVGVVQVVRKQARVTASKQMFQSWATALEQYKATYKLYPYIGADKDKATGDHYIDLSSRNTVGEFVKALSGKTPVFDANPGQALPAADARKYNRMGKEFCSFGSDSLEVSEAGAYTGMLKDAFGNTRIRIYVDADGNGLINPVPAEITSLQDNGVVNGSIAAKVIIYTLKSDGADFENILSWQ